MGDFRFFTRTQFGATGFITERGRPHFGLFEASMMFPVRQLMFHLILLGLRNLKWGKTIL